MVAGTLPLALPSLLFVAFWAAMAESGGKEPDFLVALACLAASAGVLVASWSSLKMADVASVANRIGLLALFVSTSFVLTLVVRRALL